MMEVEDKDFFKDLIIVNTYLKENMNLMRKRKGRYQKEINENSKIKSTPSESLTG